MISHQLSNRNCSRPGRKVKLTFSSAGKGGRIFHHQKHGNGPRLCAEHQPQRHGEARRFRTTQRLWASALAAAGSSDTAAIRWWFQATQSLGRRKKEVT